MVAHGRGQILERRPDHHQQNQCRQSSQSQLTPHQATGGQILHGLTPPPPAGQHHAERQHQQHVPGQQIAHFAHIRLHGVGHHGGVNDNAISDHEITVGRGHHEQHHACRLAPARPNQQAQQHGRGRQHDERKTHQTQPCAQAVGVGQRPHGTPKGQITRSAEPQGQHQQKTQGMPGATGRRIRRNKIGN